MSGSKFGLPARYSGIQESVWVEFGKLVTENKPLNLGHGFPDFEPPEHLTKALAEIASSDDVYLQQYTRGLGHPRLVNALSKLYSKLIGREIDAKKEIMVSSGAYEALFSSIEGHVDEGDEVIIIEPYFDSYDVQVIVCGGVPVYVPLRPKTKGDKSPLSSADWVLDPAEFASKFNSKTKAVIINTPLNPLGKVFTVEELNMIAEQCIKWDTLCISDEVYEWLVYEPYKHVRINTLPGMWDRTITIGSAGKTFNITGWKLGWAYGPENLLKNLIIVHQNCVYTSPTPLQEAVARGFELELTRLGTPECFFNKLKKIVKEKRDFMGKFLTEVGMKPIIPQGGYFIVADWSSFEDKINLDEEKDKWKDYRFAKYMSKHAKLQGIPPSAFYSEPNKHLAENYIRYCFIKKEENLQKAAEILQGWKNSLK